MTLTMPRPGSAATHVFHRAPRTALPTAVGGEGVYLIDAAGNRYLDACGGAAVSCLGHGHPRVIAAIRRQAEALAYAHTSFFTTGPAEDLAALLAAGAPAGLDHVYFVSGGSEAMEAALKLARQARGLMVYPMGGTIDGRRGDHVLLAPPFICTEDEIGQIVERLAAAIGDAIAAAKSRPMRPGASMGARA